MSRPDTPAKRYELSPLMLQMLVCPVTKTHMSLNKDRTELLSKAARLAFPIAKGVPLLCLSEARPLSEEEADRLR